VGAKGTRHVEALVALAVLLLVAPPVHRYYAQQASRYALTAAVADDGTLVLDGYVDVLGIDRSVVDGHTYSDKAPAQPLAGVPLYALYRAIGGEPATELRTERNLGLWWQTLWFAAIPAAALAVLIRREASLAVPDRPSIATATALALVCGTLLLPFGAMLFTHVLTAALGLAAARHIAIPPGGPGAHRHLLVAGALLGTAVAVEYTALLLVLVLAVAATLRHAHVALIATIGAAVPIALLGWYHTAVFGRPWETGYRHSAGYADLHAQGALGFESPRWDRLGDALLGARGLLVLSPIVLMGAVGLLARARKSELRWHVSTAAGVIGTFLVFQAGWPLPTGGDSPGPRHLLPALPFLAFGVAEAFRRWTLLTSATAVVSATVMLAATTTDPLLPMDGGHPRQWFQAILDGRTIDTVLTMATGRWAVVVPIVLAGTAAWLAITIDRASSATMEPLIDLRDDRSVDERSERADLMPPARSR